MARSSYYPFYPSTAYWLSLIGGVLIVVFAVVEVAEAIFLRSTLESEFPGSSRLLEVLGSVGLVVGVAIVVLALRLRSSPATAKTSGILIIVLSLVSYVGGGGLFIGLILAFIGGIVAARWRPPPLTRTMYGQPGYGTPIRQAPGPIPWQTPSAPPVQPGVPQKFCPHCGSVNVASAQFCAKCGAPMT